MCNIHKQHNTDNHAINSNVKLEYGQFYLICIEIIRLNFSGQNCELIDEIVLNRIKEQLKLIYALEEDNVNAWVYDDGILFIKIRKNSGDNIIDYINEIIKAKVLEMCNVRVGYITHDKFSMNNTRLSYLTKLIKNYKYIVKDKVTEEFCLDSKMKIYMEVKEDLLNNRGRYIHLHYQPKYDLHKDTTKSCEVLCRWIHPNLGVYYPNDILPIIDHLEEISLFNLIVLEKACIEIKKAGDLVDNFSINISVDDICKTEFVEKVCSISKEYNISSDKITFEIVETCESVDYDLAYKNINTMVSLGYKFSIDDFGSGYSSYFRLSSINFTEVKIPRGFLEMYNKEHSKKNKSILNGIMRMCKQLGCNIVIEGVETYEEFKLCKILRADYVQGYYISKPLSIDNYIEYLQKSIKKDNKQLNSREKHDEEI